MHRVSLIYLVLQYYCVISNLFYYENHFRRLIIIIIIKTGLKTFFTSHSNGPAKRVYIVLR